MSLLPHSESYESPYHEELFPTVDFLESKTPEAGKKEIVKKQEAMNTKYRPIEELKDLLSERKYLLDCGHKVSFGHPWANTVVIYPFENDMKIICSECFQ